MAIFAEFAQMLARDEQINFQIRRGKDDTLTVVVQPLLGEEPEGLPEDAAQLRAALTIPLRMKAAPERLDAEASGMIREYAAGRQGVAEELDVLSQLREAKKQGQSAAAKAQRGKDAPAKTGNGGGSAPSSDVPPPSASGENPDSVL